MATGLEIIGLINNSIEVIKFIRQTYDLIKTFDGLPKAFHEVNNQLPLVQDTLGIAKERVSSETKAAVKETLEQCCKSTRELWSIFEALKDAKGNSIKKVYKRTVLSIGKRGRVEDLMKDVLSNVKKLSENQVFQLAEQVDKLQKALESLAKVMPSIPENEMDSMFEKPGLQQIGDHNVQNYAAGGGDAWNVHGTVNKGENFTQTNNYRDITVRRDAVVQWLKPSHHHHTNLSHFSNDRKRAKHEKSILDGTGQWLLDKPSFQEWIKPGSPSRVFWLYGDAGYGKSVLCIHAIRRFEERFKDLTKRAAQAACHFYDYSDEPDALSDVYRNLADGLFRQTYSTQENIPDKIFDITGNRATVPTLKEFITAIIEELKVAYIFLDGLDEVFHDSTSQSLVIDALRFCLELTKKAGVDVKVWCSSQDRKGIRQAIKGFQPFCSLHLTSEENGADIQMLLLSSAMEVLDEGSGVSKMLKLIEIKNAIKGNFLWASLAVAAVKDAGTIRELHELELLKNTPQAFEKYLKKKIRGIRPEHHPTFSQVLSCLVFAKRPLSKEELCEAINACNLPVNPKKNIPNDHGVFFHVILEKCSPFVRVEEISNSAVTQRFCSVYHTSVRLFLQRNPRILDSKDAPSQYEISPRILAHATLRYLQQPRYRNLLQPAMTGTSATFRTACRSDIVNHHLLIYSVKNWAKHVDDYRKVSYSEDSDHKFSKESCNQRICLEVDKFIRSKNFGTCLQLQSLFVQARFSTWYLDEERRIYFVSDIDNRNKKRHFNKGFPSCYSSHNPGQLIEQQYHEAVAEWGYFLCSFSAIQGRLRGEIDRCLWQSLGKFNFMHGIPSRLRSYRLETGEEHTPLLNTVRTSYFNNCGQYAQEIRLLLLEKRMKGCSTDTISMQAIFQRWTMKKPGHRHKLRGENQMLEVTDEQLRLYTQPLQHHEVGRAAQVIITGCGGLLRIGSKLYAEDAGGRHRLLNLGGLHIEYVEEICRRGQWIAAVHRRRVKATELPENPNVVSNSGFELEAISNASVDEDGDIAMTSSESSASSSSSSTGDEASGDEESPEQTAITMSGCPAMKPQLEENDQYSLSEASNSARDSYSEGSTMEFSDGILDESFWNDWKSEDEDIEFKDIDAESDESSSLASQMIVESEEDSYHPKTLKIRFSEEDTRSEDSDISLKSNIPPEMWGDSDSASDHSEDKLDSSMEGTINETTSGQRELVIFNLDKFTNLVCRRFHFTHRWAGKLFNSPPVIHPTHDLAIWPLGRSEILFANFTGNTYFIRTLGCGARNIIHISVQAHFSACGEFLHLGCLDGRLESSTSSEHSQSESVMVLRQLYLRVFTYRLSHGKPARSPPKLVYRAEAPLDCHLLREGDGRLPACPLPYSFTWTQDHIFATESYRVLRVFRLPLHRRVEELEFNGEALQVSSENKEMPDCDEIDDSKPVSVAFTNEAEIFLPKSADRRSVHFFPTVSEASSTTSTEKHKKKNKTNTPPTSKVKNDGKVVATVVISSEVSLLTGIEPYTGPPQVVCVTAERFGSWKRLCTDSSKVSEGKECAETWKGGQLEARYEKFDQSQDCDIVPYFR